MPSIAWPRLRPPSAALDKADAFGASDGARLGLLPRSSRIDLDCFARRWARDIC